MSEPGPKTLPDTSEAFSFFQSETESLADELDTKEIALSDILLTSPTLIPQPPLDSDNDCACE